MRSIVFILILCAISIADINVCSLGAIGDGSDSNAVRNSNALDSAVSLCKISKDDIYIPNGIYKINRQWCIHDTATAKYSFVIRGQNKTNTIIEPSSSYSGCAPLVFIRGKYPSYFWNQSSFSGITIRNGAGFGLVVNTPWIEIFNVMVSGCDSGGINHIASGIYGYYHDISLSQNNSGDRNTSGLLLGDGRSANYACTRLERITTAGHGCGIKVWYGVSVTIRDCDVSGNDTGVCLSRGSPSSLAPASCTVDNLYMELHDNNVGVFTNAVHGYIYGGRLDRKDTTAIGIMIGSMGYYNVIVMQNAAAINYQDKNSHYNKYNTIMGYGGKNKIDTKVLFPETNQTIVRGPRHTSYLVAEAKTGQVFRTVYMLDDSILGDIAFPVQESYSKNVYKLNGTNDYTLDIPAKR